MRAQLVFVHSANSIWMFAHHFVPLAQLPPRLCREHTEHIGVRNFILWYVILTPFVRINPPCTHLMCVCVLSIGPVFNNYTTHVPSRMHTHTLGTRNSSIVAYNSGKRKIYYGCSIEFTVFFRTYKRRADCAEWFMNGDSLLLCNISSHHAGSSSNSNTGTAPNWIPCDSSTKYYFFIYLIIKYGEKMKMDINATFDVCVSTLCQTMTVLDD